MQQTLNAVIYARYSSHNQTEQSIEGQLRDCYAFAERQGLQVVGEYIDRAITGRTDERPDFQRMIADAKKQQFQRLVVSKGVQTCLKKPPPHVCPVAVVNPHLVYLQYRRIYLILAQPAMPVNRSYSVFDNFFHESISENSVLQ